ncbi:MAG: hypothetical protein BWY63_01378 [Chloroflexi bacterium ADurb.Bin360]|nr:MAG: hypothetical protein BWY63_01378 [Chloroflexi bacterium ADurb.Bin360]
MPEKRHFKTRKRVSGVRDPKLIIIAAEGARTERTYFEDMASPGYFYNPRIHVEVLERDATHSAPEAVLQSLDEFYRQYQLKEQDELWLVLDTDRWGTAKLAGIATLCYQKGYLMAASNPCFELWLLLHLRSLDGYSVETLDDFRINRKTGDRTRLERELLALLGEYNKAAPKTEAFLPHVGVAIERARALDIHSEDRWPQDLGTRVYLLAEHIMEREPRVV